MTRIISLSKATFFILLFPVLSFVSVAAGASSLNTTSRNATSSLVSPTVSARLTIPETVSAGQSNSVTAGNCDATCFKTEQKRGLSCAFVTSAGTLLSTNLGKTIDTFDVVMRSPYAPVRGYEKHVGSRSDVRSVAYEGPVWAKRRNVTYAIDGSESIFVVPHQKSEHSYELCQKILSTYRQQFPSTRAQSSSCVMSEYSDFDANGTRKYPELNHYATTGFLSTNFLASICDTLVLFGTSVSDSLDASAQGAGYNYHFYPGLGGTGFYPYARRLQEWHDFVEERNFFLKRSNCACRDGYTGVIYLDVYKMRPIPQSSKPVKYDESIGEASPGGLDEVAQLFRKLKSGP